MVEASPWRKISLGGIGFASGTPHVSRWSHEISRCSYVVRGCSFTNLFGVFLRQVLWAKLTCGISEISPNQQRLRRDN